MKTGMRIAAIMYAALMVLAVKPLWAAEPVVIENYDYGRQIKRQIFEQIPRRVVSTNGATTEMLLKLGLEEYLLGTAYLDNPILPELEAAYRRIPVISSRYPTKEQVLSLNPDLIVGWHSAFSQTNLGDVAYWNKLGVKTYMMRNSGVLPTQKLENCLDDLKDIGRIFQLDKRADLLIEQVKADIKTIENETALLPNRPLVLCSTDESRNGFLIRGTDTLISDLVMRAGGENALKKSGTHLLSLEQLISIDPEVIIIVYMIGDKQELSSRIEAIYNNPLLSRIKAVKNKRIHALPLVETYCAGVRAADGLRHMAMALHPEVFNENSFK